MVIAAGAMTMVMVATALGFDIGREVDTNRTVQAVADAVALDAANFLDGTTATAPDPYTPIGGSTYDQAQVIQYQATESAMRNDVSSADQAVDTVVMGTCASSTSCPTFTPIEECPLTTTLPAPSATPSGSACYLVPGASASTVINAVQVAAQSVTSFVFQLGSATSYRGATAVRSFTGGSGCPPCTTQYVPVSAFSLGSTLVDFSNPQEQQVLAGELGVPTSTDFSMLSYSGLSAASVSVGDILAANAGVGTLDNLLKTSVPPSTLLGYYYNALIAQNSPSSLAAAQQLNAALGVTGSGSTAIGASAGVAMCQLLDVAATGQTACSQSGTSLEPAAYATMDAASFLTTLAAQTEVAGGSQAIGLNITGLGLLDVSLTAISPMASSKVGPADQPSCPAGFQNCPVTAEDTQAKATLSVANVDLAGLGSMDLSIDVTGADATGTLTGLSCGTSPSTETATIAGSASAADLAATYTVYVLGSSAALPTDTTVASSTWSHTFTGPFTADSPPMWSSVNTAPSVALTSPTSGVSAAILSAISSVVTTSLDPVLSPLLTAMGVDLGYATVADHYVNCNSAVLVR